MAIETARGSAVSLVVASGGLTGGGGTPPCSTARDALTRCSALVACHQTASIPAQGSLRGHDGEPFYASRRGRITSHAGDRLSNRDDCSGRALRPHSVERA